MRLQDWARVLAEPGLTERQKEALAFKPEKVERSWKRKAATRTLVHGLHSKSPFVKLIAYLSLESSTLFPELFLPEVQAAFKKFLETTLREEKQRIAQEEASKSQQQLRQEIQQQKRNFAETPKWMGIPIEPAYSSYKIYREVRLKPLYDQFIRSYGCKPSGLIIGTRVAATIIYLREQEKGEKFWEQLPHTRKEWLQFIADPLRLFPTVDPYSLDRVDFLLPNEFSILATVNELNRLEHIVYGSSDVDPEEAIARVIQKAYRNAGDEVDSE